MKSTAFGLVVSYCIAIIIAQNCSSYNEWTQSNSLSLNYYDLASDSTGKYVVAVTSGENAGKIYLSVDYGINWLASDAPQQDYIAITSDSTGLTN